jgi:hypothetical protein
MRIWRLLAEYDAETTTFSECAGTVESPFSPDFTGRLVALRTIIGGGAATSLVQHIIFRLTCTIWTPNTIHVAAQGSGLQTAPAVKTGEVIDWPVDQPIQSSVPITIEARNEAGAETPVTVEAFIYGLFEVSRPG